MGRVLRRLCCGSYADAGRPLGSDTICCWTMIFSICSSGLRKRQNSIAHELLLFQFVYHIAIVARRQVALFRNLQGNGLHFSLNLCESLVRHSGNLFGRNVDAVIFKGERIFLRGNRKSVRALGNTVARTHVSYSKSCALSLPKGAAVGNGERGEWEMSGSGQRAAYPHRRILDGVR